MQFKTFLLVLLVVLCGAFIYIKVKTLGPENSEFNQTTRISLGKHPLLRTVFSLHKDGDARAEYLNGGEPIVIEIVQGGSDPLSSSVINDFSAKVKEYTGRDTAIYNLDAISSATLTEADMDQIVEQKRRHVLPGQPNLFIMYARDFVGAEDEAARTYKEYGMVLSESKLQDVAGFSTDARNQYILSTMLHEFGHQLGLPHIDGEHCIMNASVESPSRQSGFSGIFTPTSFCNEEKQVLEGIKAGLK